VKRAAVTRPEPSQFYDLAKYYDALNDRKDYRGEVKRLEAIVRRFGRPNSSTWLDVGCGTGRHLEFLGLKYSTLGVDLSRKMLEVARRRLPGTRLVRGDMRTFRLKSRFDVVSCLFSAIGHLDTDEDVRQTFANFARHLNPGGVALVEPWIQPSAFRSGASLYLRTHQSPSLCVVRLSSSSRRGNHSRVTYHFLIGEPRRGIRHIEVTDVGLLLSRERLLELMRSAGLRARFLARGLTPGRGLVVGIKA